MESQNLHSQLAAAKEKVTIGGVYAHFKHPENHYQVICLAVQEGNGEISVIYQALYDPELVFVRPLKSWLETPEKDGHLVPRFQLLEAYTT